MLIYLQIELMRLLPTCPLSIRNGKSIEVQYLFIGHLNEVFKIINQHNLKLRDIKVVNQNDN